MNFNRFLIKFGEHEHLLQLQKEGLLYCNTLRYFLEIEDGNLRGDNGENITDLVYFENPLLQIKIANDPDAEYKKVPITWGQLVTRRSDQFGNLFCMYAVDTKDIQNDGILYIDKRNNQFGSHFLVILDSNKFLKNLTDSINKSEYKVEIGFVQYINMKKHSGKRTVFQKDLAYSYQQEFRIFIHNINPEPVKLILGDMSAFTKIYPIDSLTKLRAFRKMQ